MSKQITPLVTKHSSVVGGSTASRVVACPGSVALCAKMPPQQENAFMGTGTLCHNVIAEILDKNTQPSSLIGTKYKDIEFTQDLLDNKVQPALDFLNEIDPDNELEFAVEAEVSFGDYIEGAFGSVDLIGRMGTTAVILDWKFGDGVAVEVEENKQLMFYTAAAMHTPELAWVFEGVTDIMCVIAQPPSLKTWVASIERIEDFEKELKEAVKLSQKKDAPLMHGDHCRFCTAKPVCPKMTGAVDRALKTSLDAINAEQIGAYLGNAELLEQWITDLRALAHTMLENDKQVPGWKLVAKRATRQWVDEEQALVALLNQGLPEDEAMVSKLLSPAQAEKALKKHKLALPEDLVVAISSGSTLAPESDKRPAEVNIGRQLSSAMSKIQ